MSYGWAKDAEALTQQQGQDRWRDLIARNGLRVSFCGYCAQVCLAGKRSLCCGDAVYDDHPLVAEFFTGHVVVTDSSDKPDT